MITLASTWLTFAYISLVTLLVIEDFAAFEAERHEIEIEIELVISGKVKTEVKSLE